MTKIYTKTGDKGKTGLGSGKRLSKSNLRVRAYGEIDELNCVLGICRNVFARAKSELAHNKKSARADFLEKILKELQSDLFILGAQLSSYSGKLHIKEEHSKKLENWIDEMDIELEPLKNFILPGGSGLAANLHLARTVCRRAEREIVNLSENEQIDDQILVFVNRLSDLLFMMARFSNKISDVKEEIWKM